MTSQALVTIEMASVPPPASEPEYQPADPAPAPFPDPTEPQPTPNDPELPPVDPSPERSRPPAAGPRT